MPAAGPARRVPIPDDGSPTWVALEQPGDYCGPFQDRDGKTAVWFLLPCARDDDADPGVRSMIRVTSPPHTFRECDDGSLEIRASIGVYGQDGKTFAWHGWLDEGNRWRA